MMTWYKTGIRPRTMLERSMPKSSKRLSLAQLKLFHPIAKTPNWNTLPPEIRQRALPLLVRLLREAVKRDKAVTSDRPAGAVGGSSDE
jgi:hypothetical protein